MAPVGFPFWIDGQDNLLICDKERARIKSKYSVDDEWIDNFILIADGAIKDVSREHPHATTKAAHRQLGFEVGRLKTRKEVRKPNTRVKEDLLKYLK